MALHKKSNPTHGSRWMLQILLQGAMEESSDSHPRKRLCKKDLWPVSKSVKGEKKESKTAKSDIKSQPEQRREC